MGPAAQPGGNDSPWPAVDSLLPGGAESETSKPDPSGEDRRRGNNPHTPDDPSGVGGLWEAMGSHGLQWVPMGSDGFPQEVMGYHEGQGQGQARPGPVAQSQQPGGGGCPPGP